MKKIAQSVKKILANKTGNLANIVSKVEEIKYNSEKIQNILFDILPFDSKITYIENQIIIQVNNNYYANQIRYMRNKLKNKLKGSVFEKSEIKIKIDF